MTLGAGFIEDIEHPNHNELEGALIEACDNTANRLQEMGFTSPEGWLVRKVAFAYFHDWEKDSPQYAFVLPDPGNIGKRFTNEVRQLRAAGPEVEYQEQVRFYRDLATGWFIKQNTDFSQKFFSTLSANDIIDFPGTWRTYVQSGAMFDDFYMTDVLKYRVDGYNSGDNRERASFHHQLKQELTHINPDVVFVFGANAWSTVRRYLSPKSVTQSPHDETSIMETHGKLYCTDTHVHAFVVPLSHMSGQVWWRFPPEDYIDRLDTVLTELHTVSTDTLQVPEDLCDTGNGSSQEQTALDSIAEDIGEVSEFGPK